ncbi:MAG: TIGR04438 family Trp-rich protein, partial [Burkholderiales bacterium]|nr:TIGR04438 family Trp-rich protein [Burkholderiales bacterium]
MGFVLVGVLLLVMKIADFGFVADWSWLVVLAPFGLAVVYWALIDNLGITMKREMRKMDDRKRERRERDMKALGLDVRREQRVRVMREAGSRA